MALEVYHKKRKFNETSEPKGRVKRNSADLKFCVQKHAASHLHYDFRLELDGVLKSWPIPKGPSLNPAEKRLAMMVEDHPLDYITFEGNIPEGNYGAGNVIVWDIGTYTSDASKTRAENEEILRAGLKKGHMDFTLAGKKLKGRFSLIKIKNRFSKKDNAWLLIKKDDEYASNKDITKDETSAISNKTLKTPDPKPSRHNPPSHPLRNQDNFGAQNFPAAQSPALLPRASFKEELGGLPKNVRPMLATLIDKSFDDPNWIYEIKWDGYRAIAQIQHKNKTAKVHLYSRNNLSFDDKYPQIVEALQNIKHDAVLDGEVVALDKDGKSNFELLQNVGKNDNKNKTELNYIIFDILHLDGKDLTKLPLEERKVILKSILAESSFRNPLIRYSDHINKSGIKFFNESKKLGLEGIIAKKKDSPYEKDVRSKNWLKIKTTARQEAVIAGFTAPQGARKLIGALILGVYEQGELTYIGHTGGGFDAEGLKSIYNKLKPLITKDCPFTIVPKTNAPATWVKPKLVCEVKFENWTGQGDAQRSMRQPIFLGLREDKNPKDVVRESSSPRKGGTSKNSRGVTSPELTHLDKVFWPDEGYTKGDVINYYEKIADIILPYLKDRPESLNRHPNGIKGESFFQKNITQEIPQTAKTVAIKSSAGVVNYLICNNKETLLYMANLGCIEINTWTSRVGSLKKPDFMIIDLDPGTVPFNKLIEVAKVAYEVLENACTDSYIKTSGKKGLHIMVPFEAKYSHDEARLFCELIVKNIHERLPNLTSLERHPDKRKNKVYLDYLQNREGQTIAAPYSLRPWPGATVSTPLKWEEVKTGLSPEKFTIKTIFARLKKYGDLWKPVLGKGIDIKKSIKCLNRK